MNRREWEVPESELHFALILGENGLERRLHLATVRALKIGEFHDRHGRPRVSLDPRRVVVYVNDGCLEEDGNLGLVAQGIHKFIPRLLNRGGLQMLYNLRLDLIEGQCGLALHGQVIAFGFLVRRIGNFGVHFLLKELVGGEAPLFRFGLDDLLANQFIQRVAFRFVFLLAELE